MKTEQKLYTHTEELSTIAAISGVILDPILIQFRKAVCV